MWKLRRCPLLLFCIYGSLLCSKELLMLSLIASGRYLNVIIEYQLDNGPDFHISRYPWMSSFRWGSGWHGGLRPGLGWLRFEMFHHPVWAVGSCCNGLSVQGTLQIWVTPTQVWDHLSHPFMTWETSGNFAIQQTSWFSLQKLLQSLDFTLTSGTGYVFPSKFSTLTHPADDVLTDFEKWGRETRWAWSEGC